jgi:hypothetical protein
LRFGRSPHHVLSVTAAQLEKPASPMAAEAAQKRSTAIAAA